MHKTVVNAKPVIVDYMNSLSKVYITSIEAGNNSSEAQEPTMKAES